MGEGRLKGSVKAAKVQLVSKKIPGHVGVYSAVTACSCCHDLQSKQSSWSPWDFSKRTQAERAVT